jgi:hypothetical protein
MLPFCSCVLATYLLGALALEVRPLLLARGFFMVLDLPFVSFRRFCRAPHVVVALLLFP